MAILKYVGNEKDEDIGKRLQNAKTMTESTKLKLFWKAKNSIMNWSNDHKTIEYQDLPSHPPFVLFHSWLVGLYLNKIDIFKQSSKYH